MVSVGYSWCGPRMWTQSSYLMANPYLSVKWELSNSPWNLHLRYRLPIAQSWRLTESVKLCVLQGRTDDYSSWLLGQCWIQYHCQELMYIINQEKTPLQMTSQLQCCHFLYIGYIGLFYRIFAFSDCILMCVLFVMTALQSRSCLMLYLWSVLECYQYSLWRYIKLVNLNLKPKWRQCLLWNKEISQIFVEGLIDETCTVTTCTWEKSAPSWLAWSFFFFFFLQTGSDLFGSKGVTGDIPIIFSVEYSV